MRRRFFIFLMVGAGLLFSAIMGAQVFSQEPSGQKTWSHVNFSISPYAMKFFDQKAGIVYRYDNDGRFQDALVLTDLGQNLRPAGR